MTIALIWIAASVLAVGFNYCAGAVSARGATKQ